MHIKNLSLILSSVFLVSLGTLTWADSAPVYDVDNYPPQFDGQPSIEGNSEMPQPQPQAEVQTYAAPSAPAEFQASNDQPAAAEPNPTNPTQVNQLQNEVQGLRDQVEKLNHQLQQVQSQQRTQYSDLDKRLAEKQVVSQPEPPKPTVAPVKPVVAKEEPKPKAQPKPKTILAMAGKPIASTNDIKETQPNVAEEQQIYQTAYNYIKAKKYKEAVAALQSMLQKYPTGQFAANAHYWLGELYGLMNQNDLAAKEFNLIIKNYSDSPKVSDAHLKLGLIYAAQLKWSDAKSAFKKVINKYPGSTSARIASEQLKQISEAGH